MHGLDPTSHVCRIKQEFKELIDANAARPPAERLPRSHFDIDPELRQLLQEEAAAAAREAEAEMAFESEKQRMALAKLKGAAWNVDVRAMMCQASWLCVVMQVCCAGNPGIPAASYGRKF